MTLNLTAPPPESQLKPRIVVVGVGGAGSNAVNNMIASNLKALNSSSPIRTPSRLR